MISFDLPDGIIDKDSEKFKELTEFSKKVMKTQFELMNNDKLNETNERCLSCMIRNVNKKYSFPCHHYMKIKRKENRQYLLQYDDLPDTAFVSKDMNIEQTNCSLTNIPLPNEFIETMGVVMKKQQHNTNSHPCNNVDHRKISSKDVYPDEENPCGKTGLKMKDLK